ncbi:MULTISPECIES: 6-phosphofructokinase [Olivibacter]|uniref:ATP-dependent 6-phosphofructokinase n=2 Tax=Olivibacter TaxID=376469 RepID=A0ABV6HNT7_9SPHI|nr:MULTISPECIES: 6-phosphofructokinase [Olivibacter]MCL4641153.1 6-phosphofructokinase [Olivibacter sp. UJ_SKK_5.1]MDM8175629.1 6-phosphofructokinase [Olivibacter sp. 47]MDX3914238.1 6-phosphofructokinase [Pseudosphingobacterium sp.]QEL02371.1 6-phosphofructokinase [Olivibacter sp. LS-1]
MDNSIKRIGVFTSGGDAPGMNACIRAVVRTAIYEGKKVSGILHGYQGMIDGNIIDMNSRSVSNILQLGGTILKTARCLDFRTPEGRKKAYDNIRAQGIDALVAIGGDGTFTGAEVFSREYDIPVVGVPGTIDNDLYGSDFTLGYDTANNTVIDAIDKIRDTAASHDRLFFIEVMGRDSGCIALNCGIAGGAEAILLPEKETGIDELIQKLENAAKDKKTSTIVIVAEGDKNGGAYNVAKRVQEKFDFYDTKVTILGHLQRGGSPSSFDRVLASRLGFAAVKRLLRGETRIMVGLRGNDIVTTPLEVALRSKEFKLADDMIEMMNVLAI